MLHLSGWRLVNPGGVDDERVEVVFALHARVAVGTSKNEFYKKQGDS